MSRILVVEDNPDILVNIVNYLSIKGASVDAIHDGMSALSLLDSNEYDVLILDLTLPGMDGIEICKHLRAQQNILPIIMLTARDSLDDKLLGFDVGADDYLIKPFALPELWSRVQALLKRSQNLMPRRLKVDQLELDLDSHRAMRGGKPLALNPKCIILLELLMRQSPRAVTRETLTHALWQDAPPDTDSLKSHIYLLRHQLDKNFEYPLLHTLPGVGYWLGRDLS